PLLPVTYAFAVAPGRPDLVELFNQQLAAMQRDGRLLQLQETWLETPPGPGRWLPWGVLVLLVLAGVALQRSRWRHQPVHPVPEESARPQAAVPSQDTVTLLQELGEVLRAGGLDWWFQPQISVSEQRVVGA